MVKQRRLGYTIATMLLLATVTACQPARPEAQQQPTPAAPTSIRRVPTASPTPSPTPAPSSSPTAHESFPPPEPGESKEIQAVRKGWEEHEAQLDRYMKDSSLNDLTALVFTTTGQASIDVVQFVQDWRKKGQIRVGDAIFRSVSILPPERNDAGVKVSTLTVCKDFTNQQVIIEKTGKPAEVDKGQEWTPTVEISIIMQQEPSGQWVVADEQGGPKKC